jgi:hypothetical protein
MVSVVVEPQRSPAVWRHAAVRSARGSPPSPSNLREASKDVAPDLAELQELQVVRKLVPAETATFAGHE